MPATEQTRVFLAACICTVAAILFVIYFHRDRQLKAPALAESHGKSESNGLPSTLATPGLPIQQGYMLALSYSDQMTAAVTNLKSLMCLAKKIGGVQVVEPFVTGSLLGLNLTANWTKEVKMTDVLDNEVFKNSLPLDKFGELASFKTFLQNTPRKLLMVQCCRALFCRPCKDEGLITKTRVFCEWNGLELVGVECVDFEKEKTLSLTAIKTHLYSKYSKSEVVILFEVYGGILTVYHPHRGYRFYSNIKECSREGSYSSMAASRYVLSDADRYIQKYLNGSSYISLMIRMEMVLKKSRVKEATQRPIVAKQCFDNLLQKLNDIGKSTGLKQIFLTIDIGRYGSKGFRHGSKSERAIEDHAGEFMSTIYGRNMSLSEWEERYISTCKLNNPGYVAMVQKQIAARGEVLVLSGLGSSYQQSAKILYEKLHQKRQVYSLTRLCK